MGGRQRAAQAKRRRGGDEGESAKKPKTEDDDLMAQLAEQFGGGGESAEVDEDLSAQLAEQLEEEKPKPQEDILPVQEEKKWKLTISQKRGKASKDTPVLRLAHRYASEQSCIRRLQHGCFVKSCKWSPDGTVLLTNSEDNLLRLFALPDDVRDSGGGYFVTDDLDDEDKGLWESMEHHPRQPWAPVLTMSEGECIYDYAWYPKMQDAANCCFVTSCRDHPLHLWDAMSGDLRATYQAFTDDGGVASAHSVAFSPSGDRLVAGYKNAVRIFDPSRDTGCEKRATKPTKKKGKGGLAGIVSCLDFNPCNPSLLAMATFTSQLGIIDLRVKGFAEAVHNAHSSGGVTCLAHSPCGRWLYSGARKDGNIHIWDVRKLTQGGRLEALTASMSREAPTNQRITFDLDPSGAQLYSGCHSGSLRVFSVPDAREVARLPLTGLGTTREVLNGVCVHPTLPVLACTTGERSFRVSVSGLPTKIRVRDDSVLSEDDAISTDSSSTPSYDSEREETDKVKSPPVAPAKPTLPSDAVVPRQPQTFRTPFRLDTLCGTDPDELSVTADSIFGELEPPPCRSHLELWVGKFHYFESVL